MKVRPKKMILGHTDSWRNTYIEYADKLVASENAYYAFDIRRVGEMRNLAKKAKMPNWQYNAISRNSMKNSLSLSKEGW